MAEQRSAAQAIFGHLPSGTPKLSLWASPHNPRKDDSVADAVYSHLRPPQPAPPRRQLRQPTGRELDQRCDEIPDFEAGLAAMGLRRVRRR